MTINYNHKYLQVEGHKLAYFDEGAGPPVLLIHGSRHRACCGARSSLCWPGRIG